jgi:hypothetical protein
MADEHALTGCLGESWRKVGDYGTHVESGGLCYEKGFFPCAIDSKFASS